LTKGGLFSALFTDRHDVVLSKTLKYNYQVWVLLYPKQKMILPHTN